MRPGSSVRAAAPISSSRPCRCWAAAAALVAVFCFEAPRAAALSVRTGTALEASAQPKPETTPLVRLVTLHDLKPKAFSICLMNRNENLPWLRLMLRAVGNPFYNTTKNKWANDAANRVLNITKRDVGSFFAKFKKPLTKAVIVRDPVTRLLAGFLGTCRTEGFWESCRGDRRTSSFEEFVANLAQATPLTIAPEFRPQMDMCNLRKFVYDVIGHFEHPSRDARNILEAAGLWEKFGTGGWGAASRVKFSDIFEGDLASQKVCEFYTPELLDQVEQIYADDFKSFSYNTHKWRRKCREEWGADPQQADDDSVAVAKRPLYLATGFESHSGCAPTEAELLALSQKMAPTNERPPLESRTFYLHNTGAFDFSPVIKCLLEAHNLKNEWGWQWDDKLYANSSEHLGELALIKALEKHPQRTNNIKKASFHILAIAPFASYLAVDTQKCGTDLDHAKRMMDVRNALEAMPTFKLSGGRNFFAFSTHFRISDVFTPPLLTFIEKSDMILGTGDLQYNHWKPYPNIRRRMILPYRAHYLVDEAAADLYKEPKNGGVGSRDRHIGFLFRGKITRSNEGSSRSVLRHLAEQLQQTDVQDAFFFKQAPSKSSDLAKLYLNSKFCLVPAGDTPTSRRLYDALGAGCVPVMLGNFEQLVENLPFTHSVDWTRHVLFAGSLQCLEKDDGQSSRWLNSLLELDNEKVQSIAKEGRTVYRKSLSYGKKGAGIVDAVLLELSYMVEAPREGHH